MITSKDFKKPGGFSGAAPPATGTPGEANTGAGGGASRKEVGGAGGDGTVIVYYPI